MAGLAGLPYLIQYQGQLQQQEAQKQQMAVQAYQFQQAQQAARRQQAAQQAAGAALPQLLAPPPTAAQASQIPPPQPPMPGQASQPMVQPGQMPSAPQNAQQAPQPIQPYRPLPTTPPPQQAAPSLPPPPGAQPAAQQGGPLSFQRAVETLQAQGLEGADLMAGLAQLQPVLDTQAKLQNAQLQQQFNQEVKLAQLQTQRDNLDERIANNKRLAEDRQAALEDRRAARAESNALRAESIALRKATAAASQGEDAKFTPEDLKFLAEQARAGDNTVYQNLGRGAQGAKNIIALRREVMRQSRQAGEGGADIAAAQAGYQGEKAAARTAGTRAANVELAVSEAQNTFPLVRQASAALPRTQFVPANRAIQAAQTNTGDPRVIALGTALNTSVNAYARAISPTGTPTVSDKEHARELLNTASTPEQLNAVLGIMEKEMAAARAAPREVKEAQRERISGRKAPEASSGPAIGTTEGGYRFKGGDPSKQANWEKL
jgi:hypothetical protein